MVSRVKKMCICIKDDLKVLNSYDDSRQKEISKSWVGKDFNNF